MITVLCPICKNALYYKNRCMICQNGHTIDVAAERYINLTCGRSGSGDSRDMCRARRDFLRKDYYKPFAELIAKTVKELFPDKVTLIDAGCGEGYYLRGVSSVYYPEDFQGFGIDLAKDSIKFAAKAQKQAAKSIEKAAAETNAAKTAFKIKEAKNETSDKLPCKATDSSINEDMNAGFFSGSIGYAVCGIFDMPFENSSFDCLLSVFAPVPEKEAARVLKPGGVMLVSHPGAGHLSGMKSSLYESTYENDEMPKVFDGFTRESDLRSHYNVHIDKADLMNLLMMTPYYWKTSKSDTEKYLALDGIDTELDFIVSVYRKNGN